MLQVLKKESKIFAALLSVVLSGLIAGFIGASIVAVMALFFFDEYERLFFLLLFLILIFILADNFDGPLAFAQNLRFISLTITLVVLSQYYFLKNNIALSLLAFTIFTLAVTYFLSPIGLPAILRSAGHLIVGICIFKLAAMCCELDREKTAKLFTQLLFFYFFTNILLFFFPVFSEVFLMGRFTGLMANPNGLGLIAMFSYALISWTQKKEKTGFPNWFFLSFKLMLIFLIILTGSRTALLSLLAFELINRFIQYKLVVILSVIALAFFNVILYSVDIEILIRTLGLSDYLRADTLKSASGRTEVWGVAFKEFKENLWLGQGMLYDNYYIDQYASRRFAESVKERQWNGIWNSYLSLGLNVGLIGMALFTYFWVRLFQNSKDKVFRIAFMAMILISAITESWLAASMNAFMPMIFLVWALQIEPEQKIEEA